MAGHGVIRLGDPTTGGGKVISCALSSFYTVMDIPGAVYGDMATCLKHKGVFPFVECDHSTSFNDRGVVLEGHKLACGCSAISTISTAHAVTPTTPQFVPAAVPASIPAAPGDGDLAQAAYGDPQEWTADTGDGSATPRHVLVTLRIGVFFDGTANNATNATLGEQCRANPKNIGENNVLRKACEHVADNSYENGATNIAKLFELYMDSRDAGEDQQKYFLRIYVEGEGTTASEGDDLRGLAMGDGETGVPERVDQAFYRQLSRMLKTLASENPGFYIDELHFDVFGFSRGSAAARSFVNAVNKKNMGPLGHVVPQALLKLKPGFDWKNDIQIDFVGLFDTVAMMGGGQKTGETWRAPLSNVELELPVGCARKVVHITARDEHRLNFPLTSAAPPFADIPMPGVHADIGGGYLPEADEIAWMTKPTIEQEPSGFPIERSRAVRQATSQLIKLQASDPVNAAAMKVEAWSEVDPNPVTGWFAGPMQTIAATVTLKRHMTNGYSHIPLHIMHDMAVEASVPFGSLPSDPRYLVPEELESIAAKLISYAKSGGQLLLTHEEESLLARKYIHRSSNWNLVKDWLSGGPDLFFPNRPSEDGKRTIYPNRSHP